MSYSSIPFTFSPNAGTVPISFNSPYDNSEVKEIELSIIKYGSNDARGWGYSNGTNSIANFTVSNSATRKSDHTENKCVYIQEYNGTSWIDKVIGTVDLSTAGEVWFSFTNFDPNYYIQGIARFEI